MQVSFWSWSRVRQFVLSLADQGLSVGGMFLVNIALARTQSKTEYGVFALCYSVFTFLAGLHNAAILETYTIYGSGRYSQRFADYEALLWRSNGILAVGLTAVLIVVQGGISWSHPGFTSRPLLGMALASAVLLTASFVRRTFYMRRRPDLAARFSGVHFVTCSLLLLAALRTSLLSGLTAFLIAAVSWCVAAATVAGELPGKSSSRSFTEIEPAYWAEHWKYARWVFVTALVFQFTTQAYYWLAAGLLNVREVANLRALYNVVALIDQGFIALTLLVLPALASRYASGRRQEFLSLVKRYATGAFATTALFVIGVRIVGRPVMHLLYAGKFDDVSSLLYALAFVPLIMGLGNAINAGLKGMEKPKAVFYGYLASGGSTLFIGIPLILYLGLWGAVFGILVSAAVYTTVLGYMFVRLLHASDSRASVKRFARTPA
jgi:O-antigen/teichoic acid export membrane protein